MQLELTGKNALVTGSSRGIGRAIAEALSREGCRVALNARSHAAIADIATTLPGAVAIAGDVTSPDGARRVVAEATAELGSIDILVCNVGNGRSVPPGGESYDEWQRVFAANLWSATNTVEAARAALAGTRGAIVCVSSICGIETIPGAPVTYSAAKAALNAYVRGMARPLGLVGVRINAVAPGNILSPGSTWEGKVKDDAAGVTAMLKREVSLGRLGEPGCVADAVTYLVSPRSEFVTGSVWVVDGGQVHS